MASFNDDSYVCRKRSRTTNYTTFRQGGKTQGEIHGFEEKPIYSASEPHPSFIEILDTANFRNSS